MSAHCCSHTPASTVANPAVRRVLWIALVVNAAMFAVELAAGAASGSVSLRIIVNRKGYVSDVTYLSGQEELKDVAMLTASELRYKPFLREGQPVEGITTVSVTF